MTDNFPAYTSKVPAFLSRKSMAKLGILAVYGTVLQAFFRPLALVTYARYDPAVKDKHSH